MTLFLMALPALDLDVQVPLSAAEPTPNAVYTAGSSTWHLRTKRLGALQASESWLTCTTDGRWVQVDVRFDEDSFPHALPAQGHCVGTRGTVTVNLTGPEVTLRKRLRR